MEIVNEYRRGKEYSDKVAAVMKNGNTFKKDLKESPFVRQLEYGVRKEGYWTYESMVLQLEDCIDVLKALHGEEFDYVFLFDHSNGHDRMQDDGLNANSVGVKFGGKQPKMRDTMITEDIELGPFDVPGKLKVGDTQTLVFSGTSNGPF